MPVHEWKLSVRGERRKPSFIRQLTKYLQIPGMISLGGGLPHPKLNPLRGLKMSSDYASEVTVPQTSVFSATAFVPTLGIDSLRDWIRYYMTQQPAPPFADDTWDFIIGNGSQDLLQRIFDLILDPDDTLLVEEYTYSGALASLWPVGCELVKVPMDEYGLDPDALESMLRNWNSEKQRKMPKAIYIVPVAQNPTGTSLSNKRKAKIYELACSFNFVIIEDDPYWNLTFVEEEGEETEPRTTFWSQDVEQRVIRLESLSKITAVGYRVGWACGPRKVIEALSYDLEAGAQSGSGIAQLVVLELVGPMLHPSSSHAWDKHVANIQHSYHERWLLLSAALDKYMAGLAEWKPPTGGMFAWIKLHHIKGTRPFVQTLAEHHHVLTVPGAAFSCDPETESPYIRLSFSFCDTSSIDPAISTLATALKQYSALSQS